MGFVALAGCGFVHGASSASQTGSAQIVDDTAADFAAGSASELAVDPLGWLAPDAYVRGGLHARGYTTYGVTNTTVWTDLTPALLGDLAGERYGEPPNYDWGYGRPYGLGLVNRNDYFTVVYDGEVYLDGATTLQLACDDAGFVEIDLGASQPIVHCAWTDNPLATVDLAPPAPGWYPIRGAMSEQYSAAHFLLATIDSGTATPLPADRLRARVTSAQGAVVVGAADRVFGDLQPTTSIEPMLIARDFQSGAPTYDLYAIGNQNFALRYAAQLRIDVAGSYIFVVDPGAEATDYARLLIDGAPVAQYYPGMANHPASSIDLAAGWHDIVLDYLQLDNADTIKLYMQPAGGQMTPIPPQQLRPVRARDRLTSAMGAYTNLVDASTNGPGVATIPFQLAQPGAVVDFVDFFFYLSGGEPRSQLQVALVQSIGADPLAMPTAPPWEGMYDLMAVRTAFANTPVTQSPTWQATFTDMVHDFSSGQIQSPWLVASYHGGPDAPFADTMSYVSAPHATDGALSLDSLTVTGDLHGATLAIAVRTGADAASLAAAPWVPVANGAAPAVSSDALIQYQLALASDGWAYPEIDKVEIDYTTP